MSALPSLMCSSGDLAGTEKITLPFIPSRRGRDKTVPSPLMGEGKIRNNQSREGIMEKDCQPAPLSAGHG
jgi:hypothetical protein